MCLSSKMMSGDNDHQTMVELHTQHQTKDCASLCLVSMTLVLSKSPKQPLNMQSTSVESKIVPTL